MLSQVSRHKYDKRLPPELVGWLTRCPDTFRPSCTLLSVSAETCQITHLVVVTVQLSLPLGNGFGGAMPTVRARSRGHEQAAAATAAGGAGEGPARSSGRKHESAAGDRHRRRMPRRGGHDVSKRAAWLPKVERSCVPQFSRYDMFYLRQLGIRSSQQVSRWSRGWK